MHRLRCRNEQWTRWRQPNEATGDHPWQLRLKESLKILYTTKTNLKKKNIKKYLKNIFQDPTWETYTNKANCQILANNEKIQEALESDQNGHT
jgi:hypothetical protein